MEGAVLPLCRWCSRHILCPTNRDFWVRNLSLIIVLLNDEPIKLHKKQVPYKKTPPQKKDKTKNTTKNKQTKKLAKSFIYYLFDNR